MNESVKPVDRPGSWRLRHVCVSQMRLEGLALVEWFVVARDGIRRLPGPLHSQSRLGQQPAVREQTVAAILIN